MTSRTESLGKQLSKTNWKQDSLEKWLRDIEIYCDACLKTEDGEYFPIHRIALHNSSHYFKILFQNSESNCTILLIGVTKLAMDIILNYIYTNKLFVTENNICQVTTALDYLLMEQPLENCVQFIRDHNSLNTCIKLYIMSLHLLHLDLDNHCYQYIQRNFETIVLRNPDFHQIPYSSLSFFLQDEYLNISSEEIAWQAIVKWVENNEDHLESVYDLLCCIRFCDIDPEYFENVISIHPIVQQNAHCNRRREEVKSHFRTECSTNLLAWWEQVGLKCKSVKCRKPKSIHYFVKLFFEEDEEFEGCIVYEMYDHMFEYWREIGSQMNFVPDCMHTIDDTLYMFDALRGIHYAFNVREKRWQEVSSLEEDKYEYNIVSLNNNIYAIGGVTYSPRYLPVKTVDVYNSTLNAWFPVESMNFSHLGTAVVLNGHIYVAGEYFDELHSMYVLSCECYSPGADKWHIIKAPQYYRRNFAMVAYKDHLYIIGGQSNRKYIYTVEKYNPIDKCWTTVKNLPQTFSFPKANILQNLLVVYDNGLEFTCGIQQTNALYLDDREQDWKYMGELQIYKRLYKFIFDLIDNPQIIQDIRQYNSETSEWIVIQNY